ncbi:hypothetical protein AWC38_SpisGene3814 [Stylophora pistillata]|uniref:Uncharacterized protein n=1 Tax=Stylophora pistillata TaxID=50429 RepID=A0A2B4SPU2_STYPI|nr:hypothetical protein AWC38_SpisGene3814 [Stylophora pistillata]
MNDPLKLLPVDITKVRAQDVVVVAAVFVAVFLFRAPDVWEFNPSWQLDTILHSDHHASRHKLPPPIITDLDSDGINEIIIVTDDSRLQVMMLPPQEEYNQSSTLPHLLIKAEAILGVRAGINSSKPVALGTGCEVKRISSPDICRQLEPKWRTLVFTDHETSGSLYFKEIAVFVAPQSGLVLIGGVIAEEERIQHNLKHDHLHNFSAGFSAEEIAKQPPRRLRNTKKEPEGKEHFSTYALNAKTGRTHWKHEPGDYEAEKMSREDVLSAYHFKLALHSSQYHVGEVHWGQFTESLISLLPYRWQHPADTTLQTAHFVKKQPLTFATQEREHNTGPAAESKAIKPNAVVIKRQKAIEVLNIESGQPLCSYDISTRATSVGDLNDDNVVDHVTAFFASERTDHSGWISPCTGNAFSGRKSLFSRSICHSPSTFGSFFDSFSEEDLRDEPELVSPLLVPSPPNKRGIFSHLSGESFKRDSIRSLDSIFVISSGRLTSLGPFGELNWQVDTGTSWTNYNPPSDKSAGKVLVPNIQAVSTAVGAAQDAVLVIGSKDFTLVSLKDGSLMASHSTPCEPVSPVVHGDFTNDGLMDFIVCCKTRSSKLHPSFPAAASLNVEGFIIVIMGE